MKIRYCAIGIIALAALWCAGCASTGYDYGADVDVSPEDHQLTLNVLNRLKDDQETARHMISATSRDGVVTLYGRVPDAMTRRRVLAVVRSTPGVYDIDDRMYPPLH